MFVHIRQSSTKYVAEGKSNTDLDTAKSNQTKQTNTRYYNLIN